MASNKTLVISCCCQILTCIISMHISLYQWPRVNTLEPVSRDCSPISTASLTIIAAGIVSYSCPTRSEPVRKVDNKDIGESNRIRTVPNTDTLCISETINPTKKCLMYKIFIIIKIVYKSIFYF